MLTYNLTAFEKQCEKQGLYLYAKIFVNADGSQILIAMSDNAADKDTVSQLIAEAIIFRSRIISPGQ
jgi:hypothetical protein